MVARSICRDYGVSAAITRALQQARGPPLLAWCQANGPCHYCRRCNVDCVFEEPQEESRRDSEGLQEEVRVARQERDEVTRARARDTLVHDRDALFEWWEAQDWEIGQLQAHVAQEQAVGPAGTPAFTAPSEQDVEELAWGLRQSDKLEVRRREWLLHKVAAARLEVLSWACEHRLLVDGISSGVSYVEEELSGQEVTLGLMRGAGRLSRLMGAHRHRTFVEARSWMEACMDGLQTPPSAEEMMQAAWDSLESEFGTGGSQGELQEEQEGGD
ncbi:hypothetical protein C0992_008764 [Termitomyces sp. T32_za158]|nr:hypothetical protein C0992_008764 [Termitomyces sp. T32_za158]